MDWILGGTIGQSHYGASISNSRVTDLVFSDNAVILAESQGLCVGSLATAQGCDSIGNQVSRVKTKVQIFGCLLDDIIQSFHVCGLAIKSFGALAFLTLL